MSWLNDLPLEKISEQLAGFFIWWSQVTSSIPASQLPLVVYVVACLLVLVLWLLVMRLIPRPLKGMSWMALAALLFAPGQASGGEGGIAPAMLGVFYGLITKDFAAATLALLPILLIFSAFLVVGAIWQFLLSVVANTAAKNAETERIRAQKGLLKSK